MTLPASLLNKNNSLNANFMANWVLHSIMFGNSCGVGFLDVGKDCLITRLFWLNIGLKNFFFHLICYRASKSCGNRKKKENLKNLRCLIKVFYLPPPLPPIFFTISIQRQPYLATIINLF